MARGGARARSGPPPDPDALRRERSSDKNGDWVRLPAAGRQGDPPPWPLDRPAQRELTLWASEWKRPQAVQWEAKGRELEVAIYVRTIVRFEQEGAASTLGSLLRGQQMDLGLSVPGLRANRWIIEGDPEQPAARPTEKPDDGRRSAKARFQALDGGRSA